MSAGRDCVLNGRVNGVSASILVDTGAVTTVLSKAMWDHAKEPGAQLQSITDWRLVGVQGAPLRLHGSTYVQLELPPEAFQINVIVAETPTADVILGRDFLRSHRCIIEMGSTIDVLRVQSRGLAIPIAQDQTTQEVPNLNLILQESLTIPPHSEIEVIGHTPDSATQKLWAVQGKQSKRCAVMVARALVEPMGNTIPMRVLNPRDVEVSIPKGTALAEMESIPDSYAIPAVTQEPETEPSGED